MEEPAASRPSRRRTFRFSLLTALVVMTCVAGYLSGYRFGVQERIEDNQAATVYPKTYAVGDLVTSGPDAPPNYTSLVDLITSSVATEVWRRNGVGDSEVHAFPANHSLVIACNQSTHAEVADLLQQLRDLRYKLPKDYVAKVREAAARKVTGPRIIKVLTAMTSADERRMQKHFESAVRQLTREFGRPERVVAAGEASFPEWATALRIAVWDRRGGKLYFALQDCRPQGQALVAGWWEEGFGPLEPLQIEPESIAGHAKATSEFLGGGDD